LEVLSPFQKELLNLFGQITESELFYLTGGTALAAFYLHHRKSYDLDFFTSQENIILPFTNHLEEKLRSEGMQVDRRRGLASFVELTIEKNGESTLIHIAQDAPFRFELPAEKDGSPKVKVDSLVDIASNKLLALFQRATFRDFVDIYFLITENHFTKKKLLELAKEKDPGFELYWLGVAFERINLFKNESLETHIIIKPCKIEDILFFFNQWREEINQELKK
jgi:predicted nucleotidyltransferase component of viral defense system